MFEGIDFFSTLPEGELDTLKVFCQERKYGAGEVLFLQWEEATAMYIVKTGLLEAYTIDGVLGHINPWEMVWEMAIFGNPKPRSATVKAKEDTLVLVLLSFSIQELGRKYPTLLHTIQSVITRRKTQNVLKNI